MALALESAGRVRQKTRSLTLDPSVFLALKGFFQYWATNKQNADLQFVPFSDTQATTTAGAPIVDAPCTVYVQYVKKGSTATDSFLKLFDDITDDSTTTDSRNAVALLEADEESLLIYPKGLTMAVGVVVSATTALEGSTNSTAGDAGNGWLIIGAAGSN